MSILISINSKTFIFLTSHLIYLIVYNEFFSDIKTLFSVIINIFYVDQKKKYPLEKIEHNQIDTEKYPSKPEKKFLSHILIIM